MYNMSSLISDGETQYVCANFHTNKYALTIHTFHRT